MQRNIWKLYTLAFLTELIFVAAVIVPFFRSFGLSMKEILITEAFFAAGNMIFEIPSGYFADIIGRKASLVIGSVFWLIAVLFYSFANIFYVFLIGAFIWGIASSFLSGASEAMLFETLTRYGKVGTYKKVQGNYHFYGRSGSVVASVVGGLVAVVSLRYAAYAMIVPALIAIYLSATLVETKIERGEHETWRHFITIFRESFVQNVTIRWFIIYTSLTGFFSIEFWLKQRYMETIGLPVVAFGLIFAAASLLSGLASKYASEIEKYIGARMSLFLVMYIPVITWIAFAYVRTLWVLPFLMVVPIIWGFTLPVFQDFVQKLIPPDRRATILSVMGFLRRGIFFVFAPYLGWVTDVYSIQKAFFISAILLFVLACVALLALQRVGILKEYSEK